MKIKIILALLILALSLSCFGKEIAVIDNNDPQGKLFDGQLLKDYKPHRVSDRSSEVYFTKDGFGVGITKGGEFTLNSNNKRLNYIGLSGIVLYDKDNPDKLYSLDITKIDKAGFTGNCEELGVTCDIKVAAKDIYIGFTGTVSSDNDKKIALGFCFPVDGTTSLVKDKQIWIYDFFDAVECTDSKEYTTPAPNDPSVSRYPFATIMTGNISFAMATSPLSRDSKFSYFKDIKSFVNKYDLTLKPNTPAEIDFVVYKYSYLWGFRSAYERYVTIFSDCFPEKINLKDPQSESYDIKELDDLNYYYKSLLNYDAYKVKGPLEVNDIFFIKCVAKNKPVYYEIPKQDFKSEYPKAVFFGFIPIVDNPSPADRKMMEDIKPVYDVIQSSSWNVVPVSETNNRNVMCEMYYQGNDYFVAAFNNTNLKRVSFLELLQYVGPTTIKNIADGSDYNIKNRTIDIVLNPYGLAMFGYTEGNKE